MVRHEHRPMPEPSPGKATILFASEGAAAKLGLDGQWVSINKGITYSFVEVDPGPHHFCVVEGRDMESLLLLTAEEGHTYYLLWRLDYKKLLSVRGDLSELLRPEWEALMAKWQKGRKRRKEVGSFVTLERLPARSVSK